MVQIISDTSTMYSPKEAAEAGFRVAPLSVSIAGKSYRELEEIRAEAFIDLINAGHIPTSSQPALGDVMSLYEACGEEEILNLSMADGLSGTYATAAAAASGMENGERIHVINTGTLCGPHRHMVETAAAMAKQGAPLQDILARIHALMETDISFLIPADFDYLRRGGRLSPLASHIGKAIRLCPVMTQSKDDRYLVLSSVNRSFRQGVRHVIKELKAWGLELGEGWKVYIVHGAAEDLAASAQEWLAEAFPKAHYESHLLTPVFLTHGGPGCVAIQAIKA